jgi:hypothetical protein
MQSKELRIGNLVKHLDYNLKVLKIGFTKIWTEDGLKPYDEIQPVELTEEILLINCRFKKSPHDIRFKTLNSIRLKTTEKGFKFNYGESIIYIKYVHQLQNLYFALTGEELIIKN